MADHSTNNQVSENLKTEDQDADTDFENLKIEEQNSEEEYSVVFTTVPDTTTADDLAEAMIMKKLAATVQIMPEVKTVKASRKHGIKTRPEVLMIMRTPSQQIPRLNAFLSLNSPAGLKADVTAVPVIGGNPMFLEWMKEMTTEASSE